MNGLKIIQTPVRFSPAVGGVEKYVLELGICLVKQANGVTVVSADEPHAKSPAVINGVRSIRLPFVRKVANTNITPALFKTLMCADCDVIHTHIPTPWSADISALVSLVRRKPLIVTYHNDLIGEGLGGVIAKAYNTTLLHLVLARAAKIVITQERYLEYSKHLKRHRKKVVTVPLGVTSALKTTAKRAPQQLFFMSVLDKYHEYKGLDVLLQALKEVRHDFPKVTLAVGGKGELVEQYRAQAKALGIADAVTFLGYVTDGAQAELYAGSAAFVLPSVNSLEGFGIVALEALAYGTPVITTTLAGSSAYIQKHHAGIIVPPKDVMALASAITQMLEQPKEAAAMGARGKQFVVEQFSWDTIAKDMTALYRSVL